MATRRLGLILAFAGTTPQVIVCIGFFGIFGGVLGFDNFFTGSQLPP